MSGSAPGDLGELAALVRAFARERDWDQFHTPKNLAMGVAIEAAELMEEFHWLTPEQSAQLAPEQLQAVRHEMADVLVYLVLLADKLGVDLVAAAVEKIALNAAKYPADTVRGKATKYDKY
ncbi:MAG: nucleotide pyrophosphohydrolase [Betaproteobacteria bacterium]|nr:MAG: nucleotide pyrophosphohydrolase [Betaproteobacteria bacterium]